MSCRFAHILLVLSTALLAGSSSRGAPQAQPAAAPSPAVAAHPYSDALLQSLEWRLVGPFRGGRCAAVAGVVGNRDTYYFGGTGGGVWKTTDAGVTWSCVSDGFFGGSIGAVAVSEWDPNVIYVGGGEKTVRGNVSHGDGMWRSLDAGKTWTFVGLADARHIPRIRIHPRQPELVYAAVLGHLYGPNPMRGVYRSRDGAQTWERVLHVNDDAGAIDLAMDPTNPRVLYASLWRVRRTPHSLESGGEGSGLWVSRDGGDTWTEITRNEGLPKGTLGIIGIAVSPSNPENLYAIIEADEGGVFRSRNGGKTWTRTNSDRALRQRAWYYTRVYADPKDEDTVYVVNVEFHRSKDGGCTFGTIATPHGDNHDLWIDPHDPLRMIEGNDGGANVSADGGATWSRQDNQPTAQFYRVITDSHVPYRIYGAQQDNSTVRIASRAPGGIDVRDWEPTAGGESGHIAPHPRDPEIVYGGSYGGYLTRRDHRTATSQRVDVWPDNPMGWGAADLRYRFQWNFPILFSPHPPHALYAAANVLFRTTDEGHTWQPISPDLTRNDKSRQGPSGGPITKDNTGVECYATIFAVLESPHQPGVLWVGSDDGLVHVSHDAGARWANVTPPELPEWTQINSIEADPFEPAGLYLAATRYKSDDFSPYLFHTRDWGKTWRRIDAGIDRLHFTRVVRADPKRRGLLYAGTERGVYVSFDDGSSWRPLQRNLPIAPITDLVVKDDDLIAATQGRSFWVLDDLTLLHQLSPEVAQAPVQLLRARRTPRWELGGARGGGATGANPPRGGATGANPPGGVVLHYFLREAPAADVPVVLEINDAGGATIQKFERKKEAMDTKPETDEADAPRHEPLPVAAGMNRYVWNMRYPDAARFPGLVLWSRGGLQGPLAPPGEYEAVLTVGEQVVRSRFEIVPDPRLDVPAADLTAQFDFLIAVRDKITETHEAIRVIRTLRAELAAIEKRAGNAERFARLKETAGELTKRITAIEEALHQVKNKSAQDPLNYPIRLNDKLAAVAAAVASSPRRPTVSQASVRDQLVAAVDVELQKLAHVRTVDVTALNASVRELDLPALTPEAKPEASG